MNFRQPIAIHTTEAQYDAVFYSNPCPRLDQLKDKVRKSEEYIKTKDEYKEIIDILDKNTGYDNIDLETLWKVADVLYIEVNKIIYKTYKIDFFKLFN